MNRLNDGAINVGIVCSPRLGGSGVVGSELAKYLSKTGKYKIVYIGETLPFRIEKDDVIFHKVDKVEHGLFAHPLSDSALTEGIVEAVLKYRLSVVHSHFAIPFARCAIQAREILKKMGIHVAVVTTLHGTDVMDLGRKVPAIMNYVLEESDAVTAVSVDLALRAKNIYRLKRDIKVVYNFLNYDKPSHTPSVLLRSKYAKPNEKIFVHISNFRPVKKVTDTLKVFLKASSSIPSVLLLIGEGPDIDGARRIAKSMKSEESIHFIGKVKNPYKYLQLADGLIITSSYESFSLVALEAMAFGVPVFGPHVGGLPEVVVHEKSGYLAENKVDIADYIEKHFSDQKMAAFIKRRAIERSKNFDARKIIPGYEVVYESLARKLTLKSKYRQIQNTNPLFLKDS